ncbi:MAG: valine--tRNA ligase [Alphaproteobacteria bacterium]
MLPKIFNPKDFEEKIYKKTKSLFSKIENKDKIFTIMMPPPNITGSLHLGHALTYTLQDILVRFRRQKGFDVLWQPGTDHAGIATQIMVERDLLKKGIKREDIGRKAFVDKVWEWKNKYGTHIVEQQNRLGISPRWERSCFTMDSNLSKAVTKAFVTLYQDGLIYRSKRLVNWDPSLKTALSDLEVINKEEKGCLWYIKYPFVHDSNGVITVATTRPETLFGDVAVAVHPDDERYNKFIGQKVFLPLTNRIIPIIADSHCDPQKGSGAVKITPAHDFNDFEIGKRHGLSIINILDEKGRLNSNAPETFRGLSVKDAREKTLNALKEHEFLEKEEKITHTIPCSERSGARIEPWVTDQWFVDTKPIVKKAIEVVKNGDVCFVPKHWEKTYFEWLYNIEPWCISRQLWWGHQIPAWYGPDQTIFVTDTEEEALEEAKKHYGCDKIKLTQDQDVLDTWFSSALWPFSTLGWPNNTNEFKRHYPTDILITGFDIIFFWVARMIMMGLHFTKQVPFRIVYIHALIRDEYGQKMSKTKGNIINPLDLIEKYGTDALRLTLAALSVPGRDIKLKISCLEGYRNFLTKIWNAARFLEMNDCVYDDSFTPNDLSCDVNKWILFKIRKCVLEVEESLSCNRFDLAAQKLYHFFWNIYCDVYVECLKAMLNTDEHTYKKETKKTAIWVFMEFLKIIHPITPFITEHLWNIFYKKAPYPLLKSTWPFYNDDFSKQNSPTEEIIEFIYDIRSLCGLLSFKQKASLAVFQDKNTHRYFKENWEWIAHLANLKDLSITDEKHINSSIPIILKNITFFLIFDEKFDFACAKELLNKNLKSLEEERSYLKRKLDNELYKKAKPDQWEEDNKVYKQKIKEYSKKHNFYGDI